MELTFVNTVNPIRGKWETVILHSRLPVSEDPNCPIVQCYQRGRAGVEHYICEKLLPDLENISHEECRHYRLHRREIRLAYVCREELVDGRYLSIRLKCTRLGERGEIESCRVWDTVRGCLCPIDLFLPRKQARGYHRWEFALGEKQVWAFPEKGGQGRWLEREQPK